MGFYRFYLTFLVWVLCSFDAFALDSPSPQEKNGARIYYLYCTLCHGPNGMGEGVLSILIDEYPETSLITKPKLTTKESLIALIKNGGKASGVSEFMPPWQDELGQSAIRDVVDFILLLRREPQIAADLVRIESENDLSESSKGRLVYQSYCSKCHGSDGSGNGKMRKIINNPPPSDLTRSIANIEYLRLIIAEGGNVIGRSGQMPPWKDELSNQEILSVAKYLMTLR